MDTLSELDETIVYMRETLRMPASQIAEQLHLSRHYVDTRLWRVRQARSASHPEGEEGNRVPTTKGTRRIYRCSFCGKSQDQVQRLIAGPNGVYICDQCVDLCREIIEAEQAPRPEAAPSNTGLQE